jgi:hypothetical protein|tara:strand:+ start:123 stop:788 length:666 start_codon:yes stop_codon:yes gene_type:complete
MDYEKGLRESGNYSEMEIQKLLLDNKILEYKINYALDKIPHNLSFHDQCIYNLIHEQANDKNSSTFREEITIYQCGYENSPGKLGEDGFVPSSKRPVEVKPQNVTDDKKLGGTGQFTDFTHSRIQKYTENNMLMVTSGFINGKLKFIVEFDFTSPNFLKHITEKVSKALPDGDLPGRYCRSASFGWNQWKDANNLKLIYLSNNIDVRMFTKPFLEFLKKLK